MKRSALFVTIVPLLGLAILLARFSPEAWTPLRIFGLSLMLAAAAALTVAAFS